MDPENCDGTLLVLRSNSAAYYLYDPLTCRLVRKIEAFDECDFCEPEPRWDASDPGLFYYVCNTELRSYRVDSCSTSTVHDFKKDFPSASLITTKMEGDASLDRRYWCFMVEDGQSHLLAVVCYDRILDRIVGQKQSGFPDSINWVGMSMTGQYCIVGYEDVATYTQVFSRDFKTSVRLPDGSAGHGDAALTTEGRDVYVYQNVRSDYISLADMGSGTETKLVPIPFEVNTDIGLHVSGNCAATPGWALVSTYGSENPPPGKQHSWMDEQLFMLELKADPRIWRMANTQSYTSRKYSDDKNYFAEAFATVNTRGTKAYWGSNWRCYSPDYTDAYQAFLPDGWAIGVPAGVNRQAATGSIGTDRAAREWYLTEGSTGGDSSGSFETWVLVANPSGDATVGVELSFLTPSGSRKGPHLDLPPGTRRSVNVADTVPGEWSVSTLVTSDSPVVAERAVYWNSLSGNEFIALPPRGSLYHGIFPGGASGEEDDFTQADVTSYESTVGKQVAWVYFSHNWNRSRQFPLETARWIRERGCIPFIRLMMLGTPERICPDTTFTLERIIHGDFDRDLVEWGSTARDFGTPLIVEYGTEVNGEWFPWNGKWNGGGATGGYGNPAKADGPERFRDAYRRIVEVVTETGANNITWVFHANWEDRPQEQWNRLEEYYPGTEWVDWVGVSAYGAQTPLDDYNESFRSMMDSVLPRLESLGGNKPIMVLEFGVTSGNPLVNQAAWAEAALFDLTSVRWTEVAGFSWWNERWANDDSPSHDTNMRVQDNEELAEAFKEFVGSRDNVIGRPILVGVEGMYR